ncbi:MAG: hypothetical protein COX81_00535 [Candidatus Magasanikbacteria bacterium CG_4_10_14_0_2_um_filter_37_12]|uniref:Methyltransferase domain-containing protein n=1 Tax=Candidatus Magasanikbacteria bacterium CG_4_10_14_0_2_um_filter_37_12 TaxID=1974637 RepID=A0A2M7V9Q9_9BACT|nr:MAG: hypothetical protein COX81_00535 [Candidatus Magasanikbacteria bacterium CG_4_10_14_0_2_um_filter_37_12]
MYHSGNQMIDPYVLFQKAQLQSGMHVADFGCGQTGHIVFPAAKVLGEKGVMYAVDVLKSVLEIVGKRASINSLLNIHTVWSDLERIGKTAIPEKSLDLAFVINTLVQSDNRHAILEEARRLLKDKARLVIVDWSKKGLTFGPQDNRFVDFLDIKRWSQMHGFVVQEEFDMGRFHKGLVLYKHD